MHIGQHIKEVMKQKEVTATQLAKDICCARPHIHRIFRKNNIDICLLLIINHYIHVRLSKKFWQPFFVYVGKKLYLAGK